MTKLLLDTDTCVYILKGLVKNLEKRLGSYAPGRVAVSAITVAELEYGIQKSTLKEQNAGAVVEFLAAIEILPFGAAEAAEYGSLRTELETRGKPIGSLDMLIASQALACKRTLVTNNTREFARIPGLKLENWMQ